MNPTATSAPVKVMPDKVHETLARHMLADGFDMVLDIDKSQGCAHDPIPAQGFLRGTAPP